MSAYTTLKITRSKARLLAMAEVSKGSDDLLEALLDAVLEKRLYNCRIVDDGEPNDDFEAGL